MSLYILDTDHVSLFLRNHTAVVQHIKAVDAGAIAVTTITVEEQLRGWFAEIRHTSGPKLVTVYTRMRAALNYFYTVRLLDFDQTAYEHYEALRKQKIRIGTQDLRIASIALAVNGTLVTRNQRDFVQVPGLALEDWTIP